jgi:hypothetical protein
LWVSLRRAAPRAPRVEPSDERAPSTRATPWTEPSGPGEEPASDRRAPADQTRAPRAYRDRPTADEPYGDPGRGSDDRGGPRRGGRAGTAGDDAYPGYDPRDGDRHDRDRHDRDRHDRPREADRQHPADRDDARHDRDRRDDGYPESYRDDRRRDDAYRDDAYRDGAYRDEVRRDDRRRGDDGYRDEGYQDDRYREDALRDGEPGADHGGRDSDVPRIAAQRRGTTVEDEDEDARPAPDPRPGWDQPPAAAARRAVRPVAALLLTLSGLVATVAAALPWSTLATSDEERTFTGLMVGDGRITLVLAVGLGGLGVVRLARRSISDAEVMASWLLSGLLVVITGSDVVWGPPTLASFRGVSADLIAVEPRTGLLVSLVAGLVAVIAAAALPRRRDVPQPTSASIASRDGPRGDHRAARPR